MTVSKKNKNKNEKSHGKLLPIIILLHLKIVFSSTSNKCVLMFICLCLFKSIRFCELNSKSTLNKSSQFAECLNKWCVYVWVCVSVFSGVSNELQPFSRSLPTKCRNFCRCVSSVTVEQVKNFFGHAECVCLFTRQLDSDWLTVLWVGQLNYFGDKKKRRKQ